MPDVDEGDDDDDDNCKDNGNDYRNYQAGTEKRELPNIDEGDDNDGDDDYCNNDYDDYRNYQAGAEECELPNIDEGDCGACVDAEDAHAGERRDHAREEGEEVRQGGDLVLTLDRDDDDFDAQKQCDPMSNRTMKSNCK